MSSAESSSAATSVPSGSGSGGVEPLGEAPVLPADVEAALGVAGAVLRAAPRGLGGEVEPAFPDDLAVRVRPALVVTAVDTHGHSGILAESPCPVTASRNPSNQALGRPIGREDLRPGGSVSARRAIGTRSVEHAAIFLLDEQGSSPTPTRPPRGSDLEGSWSSHGLIHPTTAAAPSSAAPHGVGRDPRTFFAGPPHDGTGSVELVGNNLTEDENSPAHRRDRRHLGTRPCGPAPGRTWARLSSIVETGRRGVGRSTSGSRPCS